MRDHVARRAETVAVERGADDAAIGEGDRGRAIPGLHQGAVVLVEGLFLVIHVRMAIPGFGDEHGDGVGQAATGLNEQFHGVVERGGVTAVGLDDGMELLNLVAEEGRLQDGLAGVHPVDVALHGVDFAVVGHVTEGVRELPGGEGVGGKTLVDQTDGTHHVGVGQFLIELRDLRGQEEALIDDGPGRQRRDIEHAAVGQFFFGSDGGFAALADDEQFTLKLVLRHAAVAGADAAANKDLLDVGLGGACDATDSVYVKRCIAPAEEGETLLGDNTFYNALGDEAFMTLDGHEDHADAVFAFGRKGETKGRSFADEELVGNLDENAGTVAGFRIAAAGTAMGQIDEDLNALLNDVVGFDVLDVSDEADATGIALICGIVKALGRGEAVGCDADGFVAVDVLLF